MVLLYVLGGIFVPLLPARYRSTPPSSPELPKSMSTRQRIGLAIACVVAAFVLAAVFIGPHFVQLNRYRTDVISYLEQQTGRRVEIGHLALRILPEISIRVDRFAIGNGPGFPSGNWLAVKRIDASLDFRALLRGQIVIRALKLDHPVMDLMTDARGHWNYQMNPLSGPIRVPAADPPPPFIIQEIIKLSLEEGDVRGRQLQANGQPGADIFDADGLALNLGQINADELHAMGGGAPSVQDRHAPPNPAAMPVAPSTSGRLSIASLRVVNMTATRLETNVEVSPKQIHLDNLHFDFYGGRGRGTVSLDVGGVPLRYQAQTQLTGVNIAALLAQFPSARGQMTGTLDESSTFSGRQVVSSQAWEAQQGSGSLTIRKGTWPKLKLDPNLIQLLKLAQLGSASGNLSQFSLISARWRLTGDVIDASNIRMMGEGATIDSSGTVDLDQDGRLAFQGVLNMAARRNPLSNLLASASGGSFQGGRIKIPFVVTGTVNKPVLGLKAGRPFGKSGM